MAYNMDRWRELLPDGWRPSWLPQMPFTDYHQLNLDWIIETVKEWSERLIAFFDEDGAKDLVEDVLEEHPEWVTTVMDGAITYQKLNGTIKAFTTPEAFGAVGDGVADDTAAWQAAVNVGVPVVALHDIYKCGQINVTKNISIDINGADFICTSDKLFDCRGEVVETLTGEADYTANSGYAITNSNYTNYTGFAMLKGTNNFETSREYYYGGFACTFYNGRMTEKYPISATNVTIEIINPITVHFYNCGEFIRDNPTGKAHRNISVLYGFGSTIRGAKAKNSTGYIAFAFEASLNCHASNVNVEHNYETSDNNSYIVAFLDSSFCSVSASYLHNNWWHSITTGGNYLCYKNAIYHSKITSYDGFPYYDHENALGTIMKDCTVTLGCGFAGLCDVKNLTIEPGSYETGTAKKCCLHFIPMTNRDVSIYNAENIRLFNDGTVTAANAGIWFVAYPQVTGQTHYIKEANISDVLECGTPGNGQIKFNFANTSNYVVENIKIRNTNLHIYTGLTSADTTTDISNYTLFVSDMYEKGRLERYPYIGYVGFQFNDVILENVKTHYLGGTVANLKFNNLEVSQQVNPASFSATGSIIGNGLHSRFADGVLVNPANLYISDMQGTTFNIKKHTNGHVYYAYWTNAGAIATGEYTV